MQINPVVVRNIGYGLLAAAVVLTAVSAVALAVIFAPPFFATALLAGSAVWLGPSAAVAAIVAFIAGLCLIKKPNDVDSQPINPLEAKEEPFPLKNPSEDEKKAYKTALLTINKHKEGRKVGWNACEFLLTINVAWNRNHTDEVISAELCDALVRNETIHSWNLARSDKILIRLSAEDKLDDHCEHKLVSHRDLQEIERNPTDYQMRG